MRSEVTGNNLGSQQTPAGYVSPLVTQYYLVVFTIHNSTLQNAFKGPYADHILIPPRAQPEVVHFLISNESPYFSGCKSKILALNSL